jgi:hypothetical protein
MDAEKRETGAGHNSLDEENGTDGFDGTHELVCQQRPAAFIGGSTCRCGGG